jgi:hypothetical protein
MGERLLRIAATSGLLLALLSAGLIPHLHASHAHESATVSATTHDGAPQALLLEAGGCAACRSAQSLRPAIAQSRTLSLPAAAELACSRYPGDTVVAIAQRDQATSPPRAPPV